MDWSWSQSSEISGILRSENIIEDAGKNNKADNQFDKFKGAGGGEGGANIFFSMVQTRLIKYVDISAFDKG